MSSSEIQDSIHGILIICDSFKHTKIRDKLKLRNLSRIFKTWFFLHLLLFLVIININRLIFFFFFGFVFSFFVFVVKQKYIDTLVYTFRL